MTASLLAPGHTLRGRYHILRSLAQGGFGATFLAEDRDRPKRPICVVKLLKPQTTDAETLATARRLFETEAKILDELGQHPQIPQLLAYFEEGQEFYLVEEYIEGQSLWEELQRLSPCPPAGAIALVQEILELLVFVHEHQVIHRDLNPVTSFAAKPIKNSASLILVRLNRSPTNLPVPPVGPPLPSAPKAICP